MSKGKEWSDDKDWSEGKDCSEGKDWSEIRGPYLLHEPQFVQPPVLPWIVELVVVVVGRVVVDEGPMLCGAVVLTGSPAGPKKRGPPNASYRNAPFSTRGDAIS